MGKSVDSALKKIALCINRRSSVRERQLLSEFKVAAYEAKTAEPNIFKCHCSTVPVSSVRFGT